MTFVINLESWQTVGLIIDYSIKLIAIGYVPEGRRPSSSTAWLLAILLLPYVGLPLFLLMGSPYINKRRHRIQQEINDLIENVHDDVPDAPSGMDVTPEVESLIKLNRRLTRMPAVTGVNHGFHSDYRQSLKRMTAAIDEAQEYIYVEIYIMAWDEYTQPFFAALERAHQRGVKVHLLFDHVGSWKYPGYRTLKKELNRMGFAWYLMLPLQPWRRRFRRPDLRNHRKMLIIDGRLGFMGSQNLIAPSYLQKKNIKLGREWHDLMVEMSGPIVSSMEMIFAGDWYVESNEALDIRDHAEAHGYIGNTPMNSQTNLVQLIPSGPGYTTEPNLRMFNSIVHHAKDRLVLCSPYFIPEESLLEAVTSACYRGVKVELLVSEQADQFAIDHAQSSYYQALLEAGVKIYQFPKPHVLHTKYVLADPDDTTGNEPLGVVGSSNLDIRSFGLNYEISMMIAKGNLIQELNTLTDSYREQSIRLTLDSWNQRSWRRRYVDNVMRLTSALQ
ncbi:phospholipase D-like domain-containing protein [Corynebacterium crudilactis]|uniref:Cardiolipin synthase A n=1 Tax=Corynebacterium crudilactis TaxID=1652495 RepID=A0A172QXP1_9CORY|nr:phospholipase D-like domain-containing protein [Corynebacterium crudilactis]ANE05410.1 cardiolipin synthase A [Corynebacterium crudilactis]